MRFTVGIGIAFTITLAPTYLRALRHFQYALVDCYRSARAVTLDSKVEEDCLIIRWRTGGDPFGRFMNGRVSSALPPNAIFVRQYRLCHRILSASPLDSEENQSRSFDADWRGDKVVVLGMTTSLGFHEVTHIQAYPSTAVSMAAIVSTLFASM